MLRRPTGILCAAFAAWVLGIPAAPAGAVVITLPGPPVVVDGVITGTAGSIGSSAAPSDPLRLEYRLAFPGSVSIRLSDTAFTVTDSVSISVQDDEGDPLAPTDVVRFEGTGWIAGAPATALGVPIPVFVPGVRGSLVLELWQTGLPGAPPALVRDGEAPYRASALVNAAGRAVITLDSTGDSMTLEFGTLTVPEPQVGLLLGVALVLAGVAGAAPRRRAGRRS